MLADAAVGHWAAGVLPPLVRRELTGPFDRVLDRGLVAVPAVGADLGAAGDDAGRAAGRRPRRSTTAGRAAWRAAVDEGRAEHRPWATAMHEASWAAHVSGPHPRPGRRAAARRPGVPRRRLRPADGAAGVWNAARRLRPGDGDGRPARRGLAGRPAAPVAAGHRPLTACTPLAGHVLAARRTAAGSAATDRCRARSRRIASCPCRQMAELLSRPSGAGRR